MKKLKLISTDEAFYDGFDQFGDEEVAEYAKDVNGNEYRIVYKIVKSEAENFEDVCDWDSFEVEDLTNNKWLNMDDLEIEIERKY